METKSEKVGFAKWRVYVITENGVTFSVIVDWPPDAAAPPHDAIIQLFNNSKVKEWVIENPTVQTATPKIENNNLEIQKI